MNIIEINGGLGNQMFQYAIFLKFKSMGKEVYVDDEIIINRLNNNKALKIFDVFNLEYKKCNNRQRNKMSDVSIDFLSRLRRKIFGSRKHPDTFYIESDFNNNFDENIFELDNKYLSGYWQSEKYFTDIRDDILKAYSFNISDMNVEKYVLEMNSCNAVSIHIRRGDYVNNPVYEGICTDKYYENAIKYIKEHVDNPVFYIFSDDTNYVKEKYKGKEYVIVNGFIGNKSHYDMYLMSKCKHNIVANSSFSWWGAWLNQNEEKIVICPSKWGNRAKYLYTPCDDWIKIGSK